MPKISIKSRGAAPVVIMNELDRMKLKSAIKYYCHENKKSMSALAKEIGIARQQIYLMTNAREIELQNFIRLQNILSYYAISEVEVDSYLNTLYESLRPLPLKQTILPVLDEVGIKRTDKNDWLTSCEYVEVNIIYAYLYLNYLKSSKSVWSIDRKILKDNTNKSLKKLIENHYNYQINPDNKINKFIIKSNSKYEKSSLYTSDKYIFVKIFDHINSLLMSSCSSFHELLPINNSRGFTTELVEFIHTDFLDKYITDKSYDLNIKIPIAGSQLGWNELRNKISEKILNSYSGESLERMIEYTDNLFIRVNQRAFKYLFLDMYYSKTKLYPYIPIWPNEILDVQNQIKNLPPILYDQQIGAEMEIKCKACELLEKDNWEVTDCVESDSDGDKIAYTDFIAFSPRDYDPSPSSVIYGGKETLYWKNAFTFEILYFEDKNTFSIEDLEYLNEVRINIEYDFYVVLSNKKFSSQCIKKSKKFPIILIDVSELDSLVDICKKKIIEDTSKPVNT